MRQNFGILAQLILLVFNSFIYLRYRQGKVLLIRVQLKYQELLKKIQLIEQTLHEQGNLDDLKLYAWHNELQIKSQEVQLEILDLQTDIQEFEKRNIFRRNHALQEPKSYLEKRCNSNLIASLACKLEAIFPEDWNEWQHWISDMIDDQKRMLEKGKNHYLVSLITFYRLIRFAFHIGIDKVFILATRRTTR